MQMHRHIGGVALLLLALTPTLASELATVSTNATATETLRPSLASFEVSILTTARTAVAARVDNAKTTATVRAALIAAGLPVADLKSSQLNVGVHWSYGNNGDAKADGFDAANRLRIETRALDLVGIFLDAALAAGAREVSPVSFRAEDTDKARHRALAHAVELAAEDARALAGAAHARLGDLVALSTDPLKGDGEAVAEIALTAVRAAPMGAGAPPPTTSVIIPDVTVSATAYGRWRLVPQTP